jgi:hypothetical protein
VDAGAADGAIGNVDLQRYFMAHGYPDPAGALAVAMLRKGTATGGAAH